MPNRMLRESIKYSSEIDQLSLFEEVCWYRLIVTVDDYGRYYGDPVTIMHALFPSKEDVTKEQVQAALDHFYALDLIDVYTVGGKVYIYLPTWGKHQKTRAKSSRFPSPEEADEMTPVKACVQNAVICQQIADTCQQNEPVNVIGIEIENRNRESKSESETKTIDDDDDDARVMISGMITAEEAWRISKEHSAVMDAWDNCRYPSSPAVYDKLMELYTEYGLDRMLEGIQKCVMATPKSPLQYLTKVLKDEGGKPPGTRKPAGRVLHAQAFSQRSYKDDTADMDRLMAEGSP